MANVGLGSLRFRLVRQGQHPETTLVFAPMFPIYLHHPRACSIIPCIGFFGPRALDKGGQANLNAVDEKLGFAPKGMLAHHLGFLEQRPHLRLASLLHKHEVLV